MKENGSDAAVTALMSFTSDAGPVDNSRRDSSCSAQRTWNGKPDRGKRWGRDMGAPCDSVHRSRPACRHGTPGGGAGFTESLPLRRNAVQGAETGGDRN